jgi:hypothetical protein
LRRRAKENRDEVIENWKLLGPVEDASLVTSTRSVELGDSLFEKGLMSEADDLHSGHQNGASSGGAAAVGGETFCGENGAIDTSKSDRDGEQVLAWEDVAAENGQVDLSRFGDGGARGAVYAFAEIESIHARETVLKVGGDGDSVVYLNGAAVHQARRGAGENTLQQAAVHLESGINRIL